MAHRPQFIITPSLLSQAEAIAELRVYLGAAVELTWITQAGWAEKVDGEKTGRHALRKP